MARMYPQKPVHPDTPRGEKMIFDRLRDDKACDEWIVFHSYHLTTHERKRESEADFVIFIPNKGIVVVEIKSHKNVAYKEGVWLYSKPPQEGQDPFVQAQEAM